jgi:hypothetical protein
LFDIFADIEQSTTSPQSWGQRFQFFGETEETFWELKNSPRSINAEWFSIPQVLVSVSVFHKSIGYLSNNYTSTTYAKYLCGYIVVSDRLKVAKGLKRTNQFVDLPVLKELDILLACKQPQEEEVLKNFGLILEGHPYTTPNDNVFHP